MSVDPSDDCTFWFTGQWNAAGAWSTRIGKFKFDECGPVQSLPARAYLPLVVRNDLPTTGTVSGRVTNAANSQGIPGAQVCVLSSSQCATTSSQGNYSIANVLAGSQTVRATASGYASGQQNVTVIAGGTVTANFALVASPTTGTVSGRVTRASNNQAISGAQVCVLSSNQCATTNAQGNYNIINVAAGSQTVRATASGFVTVQQTVTVPAGGTVTVNFALASIPTPTWTNITTEDFESSFPKTGWQVDDNQPGSGEYYWGKRTCRPRSGSYSGWAVGGGANGGGLSCGSNYPNNAFSWLVYGPFSLVSATDAEMLFDYWVKSELDFDELFVGASINGNDFYGSTVSGDTGGSGLRQFRLDRCVYLGQPIGSTQRMDSLRLLHR